MRDCLSKFRATGKRVHGFLIISVPLSASQKNYVQTRKGERRREQRPIDHKKNHCGVTVNYCHVSARREYKEMKGNQTGLCPVCDSTPAGYQMMK